MIVAAGRLILHGLRQRRPYRRGVRVLVYHGVVERRIDPRVEESFHLLDNFREHIRVLKRCRVVGLDEIDHARGSRFPQVAITFDDGFANNLLAAELLAEAKLPATFFVTTGNIGGPPIWPTLLRLVLARSGVDDAAFAETRAALKRLPSAERIAQWNSLLAKLRPGELDELLAQWPSIAMMSWDDVASLAHHGFTIGSHGRVHELHHTAQPAAVRTEELAASKRDLERALARPCTSFAYPNGTYHGGSPGELRAAGYARAFTMVSHAAGSDEDVMLLPRIIAPPTPERLISRLVFGG
jgi:peptidoglycan/xylan/chitin deacetylase (PgdA/CDA1 family)